MSTILWATFLRFHRFRVWIAALVLPAAGAIVAGACADAASGGPAFLGARALLFSLQWVLPPLAALFLLSLIEEPHLDLLRTRPLRRLSWILGQWGGTVAAFGACHLVLAAALFAALPAVGGGPPGRVDLLPVQRLLGEPGVGGRPAQGFCRPWPSRGPDPVWVEEVRSSAAWTFAFEGLPRGRPCRARIHAFLGRLVVLDPRGRAGPERELERIRNLPALVRFPGGSGEAPAEVRLDLRDGETSSFDVPPQAIDSTGKLVAVVRKDSGGGGEEGGIRGDDGAFFWFDPGGGGDPLAARDLRVTVGEISFAANAFRACLQAAGELLAVAALGCAAAALFSQGTAFAFTLAIYLLSSAKPFLVRVSEVLSSESALVLLSDPADRSRLIEPGWFDRGLDAFLRFWIAVLPEFRPFRGGPWLPAGEAIPAGRIAESILWGGLYAAVFLLAAVILGKGKEQRT